MILQLGLIAVFEEATSESREERPNALMDCVQTLYSSDFSFYQNSSLSNSALLECSLSLNTYSQIN